MNNVINGGSQTSLTSKLTALANACRDKFGITKKLGIDDMTKAIATYAPPTGDDGSILLIDPTTFRYDSAGTNSLTVYQGDQIDFKVPSGKIKALAKMNAENNVLLIAQFGLSDMNYNATEIMAFDNKAAAFKWPVLIKLPMGTVVADDDRPIVVDESNLLNGPVRITINKSWVVAIKQGS